MNPILTVENISKKFSKNSNQHMSYGLYDYIHSIIGKSKNTHLRKDEFYAVNDVSFSLYPGDTLGLIGRNGCGKSTLLKMINGILRPTKGKIIVDGSMQALINLGAGFNQNLTGRQNIYNITSLQGFSKKQTNSIVEEIIEFAELDDFIDSPISSYSSGMYARLGFACSIHINPDILIIDEILAVGDFAFQNKCFVKMHELKMNGTAIVLVSHSHTQVIQLCDKAIWLNNGKQVEYGNSKEVVDNYLDSIQKKEKEKIQKLNNVKKQSEKKNVSNKNMVFGSIYSEMNKIANLNVELLNNKDQKVYSIKCNEKIKINYSFDILEPINDLNISVNIYKPDGLLLTTISTLNDDLLKKNKSNKVNCELLIDDFPLVPGEYVVVMPIHEGHSYLYRDVVLRFLVTKAKKMTWGLLSLKYDYLIN